MRRTEAVRPARLIPIGVTLVIGIGLAIAAFVALRHAEVTTARAEFQRSAVTLATSVQRGIDAHLVVLESVRSFYAASQRVERSEFKRFAGPYLERHRGLRALHWAPAVPGDEEKPEGFPLIWEDGPQGEPLPSIQRAFHFPALFVEPSAHFDHAAGFDHASVPERLAAIEEARDTGRIVGTPPVELVTDGRPFAAALMFAPIYDNAFDPETEQERRAAFKGVVVGVFHLRDLVRDSIAHLDVELEGFQIHLFDITDPTHVEMLLSPIGPEADIEALREGIHESLPLSFAGRNWALVATPSALWMAHLHHWPPWAVLAAGTIFTILLASHMLTSASHTARVEAEVRERTSELSEKNDTLAAANRRFAEELELAQRVQRRLLPEQFPRSNRVDFGSFYLACEAVGGDIFDVFRIDEDRVGLYIADVSGHGLAAALIGATLKMSVEAMKPRAPLSGEQGENGLCEPIDVVLRLNEILSHYLESDKFITMIYAVLCARDRTLTLCNAGHTWPIWWHAESQRAEVVELNCGLPINHATGDVLCTQTIRLEPGDKLVFYTDGLIETLSPDGQMFGEDALTEAVTNHGAHGPQELVRRIMEAINRFAEGEPSLDDVALIVAELLGAPDSTQGEVSPPLIP